MTKVMATDDEDEEIDPIEGAEGEGTEGGTTSEGSTETSTDEPTEE